MNLDLLRLEAESLLQAQAIPQALERAADLVRLAPEHADSWALYGRVLWANDQPRQAAEVLERACGLDAADVESRTSLGEISQSLGRLDEAIRWHGEALDLAPHSLVLALNHAFIWPLVADSVAQIHSCRSRCREAFEQLRSDPRLRLDSRHSALRHTAWMAYHGINDRDWLEDYARLVLQHLSAMAPPVFGGQQHCRAPGARRLRLGFVSAFFYGHSNARAFEGLLQGLDRDRFSPVLIHLDGSRDDAVRRRLEAGVDQVVHLPADLTLACQQLGALQLDLLFITDAGMHPAVPVLLAHRVAPVQVTGWGFPVSSGFATLDYYLSGDLVEPPDGQEHYSETLVRLSGLPCRYLAADLIEDPVAASMGRSYFLLPEDRLLVGCLQTVWKIHPDLDPVLERIATEVPEVCFVFVQTAHQDLHERLMARLRRNAPTAAERMIVLASMKRAEYTVLAGCLDLLLDTPHFGSGISFYESIHTGTPIVTIEGPYLRSRYVAAGYRLMGLDSPPVVDSAAAMAQRAVALLQDPEQRHQLRSRIREAARTHLYDRLDVVRSFEAFAVEAIERATATGGEP